MPKKLICLIIVLCHLSSIFAMEEDRGKDFSAVKQPIWETNKSNITIDDFEKYFFLKVILKEECHKELLERFNNFLNQCLVNDDAINKLSVFIIDSLGEQVRYKNDYGNNVGLLLSSMRLLIQLKKFNVDIQDKVCNTALHHVCECGDVVIDLVKLLIENGANINAKNALNFTPLMYAAKNNNWGMVKLLIDHSAGIDEKNDKGETALILISFWGYSDIAQILIQAGALI